MTARWLSAAVLALLLAAGSALAAGDGTTVVVLRGTLDADLADRAARDITRAVEDGAETIVIEFEVTGAPASGLPLAGVVARISRDVRTVGIARGRVPGSALAALFECDPVYATEGARLGAIPRRGPIYDRIAATVRERKLDTSALREFLPSAEGEVGMTSARAKELGIVDMIVADRGETLEHLGVDPGTVEAKEPEVARGRRRVTGEFRRPYLVTFEGAIDDTRATSVKRRVEIALEAGADLLIFEVDSPGGLVSASLDIGNYVHDLDTPTIMLVLEQAMSGAALVSLAGDEIVMSASGELGDCQPIAIKADGYEVIGEKIQSPLRATFRKYAESNGYSTALAESMITQEMQVDRVTYADGSVFYLRPDEQARHVAEHGAIIDRETVVKKDQLLTMIGREAQELGFTGELVEDRAALLARFGLTEADLTILEETWAEETSRFLMGIKFLLFIVGILALYMEIKAPGFGVPGAIAIVCFALFFSASSIAGIATELEIILFLLGVGLLAVEVFVIPGFGIPGVAGAGLIVVSLYMASMTYGLPSSSRPWEGDALLSWTLSFGGSLLACFVGMLLIARFFPGTPIGKRMILAPEGDPGEQGLTGSGSIHGLEAAAIVGETGTAITDLRPAGRIDVNGEPWDAVTEGDWIEDGSKILVIEASANRIVVKEIEA
ncbi:MAG: NfeD family protein [Planctomycetota bacterium]